MKKHSLLKTILFTFSAVTIGYLFLEARIHTNNSKPFRADNTIIAKLNNDTRELPLYGFNGNIEGGVGWDDPAFSDSVASLYPKIIRYPGGTIANYWDWQNGGMEQKEMPNYPKPFAKLRHTRNDLRELKFIVNKTHSDAVFVLNMITRNVDDQINMLKQAQSLGIPIKWVELGNEFNARKNIGGAIYKTPLDYARTCQNWINVLKRDFPDVKIAIVGGNTKYKLPVVDVSHWNEDILSTASNADAVILHSYPPAKLFVDDSGINFEKLYNECVDIYTKQGFKSIPNKQKIWVTEYNVNWNGPDSLKRYYLTWGQSLSILLLTSTLTNISDQVEMVINHNIIGWKFGAINVKNGFKKFPNGIGMQIWLKAADGMNSLTKINLFDGKHLIDDFNAFGWEFSDSKQNISDLLLVNLSDHAIAINLGQLPKKYSRYETKFAGKDIVINNYNGIKGINSAISNNVIQLPGYSVTTVTK